LSVRETSAYDRADRDIGRLAAALGDPTRRQVFFAVRASAGDRSKDEVATTVGIDRRLAGFHLDKLVQYGFLEAEFRRPAGRSGPGAGRPAKRYRLADADVLTALPERHYDLLASLLLRASRVRGEGGDQQALERVGYEFGFEVGVAEVAAGRAAPGASLAETMQDMVRLLSRYGFGARADGADSLRACACPFEELAFGDPERICGLDRAIWRGMLAAFAPAATLSVATTRAGGDEACVATVHADEGEPALTGLDNREPRT
jgi:predicted ArsR family transcriptional regulator